MSKLGLLARLFPAIMNGIVGRMEGSRILDADGLTSPGKVSAATANGIEHPRKGSERLRIRDRCGSLLKSGLCSRPLSSVYGKSLPWLGIA